MSDQFLTTFPDDRVCVLRLNRPESHNALSVELVDALRSAVAALAHSPARVLVLAANGPSFCSGADLKQRRTMTDEQKYAHNRAINALANEIAGCPTPTIAALNGHAMGGGCELALACDLRFASSSATIGLTEARVGAMPGAGGSQRLPRLIGTARALEMMYSGEPVSAEKAKEWGLVNGVIGIDALYDHVLSFARLLASRSRKTSTLLKRVVYQGLDHSLVEGLELERLAIVEVLSSSDYAEGLAAFAERRSPAFQ